MTDRAKKAINQLMHVCRNTTYQDTLEVIESELRRCRAETLREAMKLVRRRNDEGMDMYVESDLLRLAEEAENEYRKKPVVIDAVLWDGSTEALIQIEKWIGDGAQIDFTKEDLPGIIPTSLGGVTFRLGDYVIRGVKGEVYPCKANIFEQTYEALT
jgi:hypothetical protein